MFRYAVILILALSAGAAFAQTPVPTEDPVVKADRYWQQYHAQREMQIGQQMVMMGRQIGDLTAQIDILKAELAAAQAKLPPPEPPK